MLTSLLVLLSLVLINGLFAMSEIAIVSARRVRLAQMARKKLPTTPSAVPTRAI